MKGMILKGTAFFLVGMLAMQCLFTGGSKRASADHSESARLVSTNMSMYFNSTSRDTSLPAPFNGSVAYGLNAIAIKDSVNSLAEVSYCIGYDKIANGGDSLSSKTTDTSTLLTERQAMLINATILNGYNNQAIPVNGNVSNPSGDSVKYFATQVLVWIIKHGYYDDATNKTKIENFFFTRWPSIKSEYQRIDNAVKTQVQEPKFDQTGTVTLKLQSNGKYEGTLKNTATLNSTSALSGAQVDKKSLPSGVEVTVTGDTVKITSAQLYTTEQTIKLTKQVKGKGRLVVWKNLGGDKQPQTTIDEDLDPIAQEIPVKFVTENKTPATQAPIKTDPTATVAPTTGTGTATVAPTTGTGTAPAATDAPKYEIKDAQKNASNMDTSPKTADESSITLAYKLIGASLFTMVSLFLVSLANKRKQRF